MDAERSFTEAVRQELARQELSSDLAVQAELAGLLRVAGSLRIHGGANDPDRVALELRTTSGAVARRAFALLQRRYALRPELLVRSPGGLQQRSTYAVRVQAGAAEVGRDLGLLDDQGHPSGAVPTDLRGGRAVAYLRGAFLAAGSLSAPGRAPHLEIGVRSSDLAEAVAALARELVSGTVSATNGERPRVVVKSGATIGELLTALGATGAFLAWDDRRLRRQLRSDATRLANADAANLRRTIEAAATQVRTVERVVEEVGWDHIDEPLRAVALARLANPEASLSELGELVDPPIAKSVVHRRLKRLEQLAGRLG